jgi:hypothetical protein
MPEVTAMIPAIMQKNKVEKIIARVDAARAAEGIRVVQLCTAVVDTQLCDSGIWKGNMLLLVRGKGGHTFFGCNSYKCEQSVFF